MIGDEKPLGSFLTFSFSLPPAPLSFFSNIIIDRLLILLLATFLSIPSIGCDKCRNVSTARTFTLLPDNFLLDCHNQRHCLTSTTITNHHQSPDTTISTDKGTF